MNKPSSPDPKRIGQLIAKSLSGTIPLDEELELTQWLSESEDNLSQYLKLQSEIINRTVEKNKKRKNKLFKRYLAIAASIILIATLCLLRINKANDKSAPALISKFDNSSSGVILTLSNGLNLNIDSVNSPIMQGNMVLNRNGNVITYASVPNYPKQEGFNSIQTMAGKQIKIVFLDGSMVWLNAGSTIHYPTFFNGKCRKVNITGEAFFEIAPMVDSSLGNKVPFIVSVNGMEIIVKGTKFNVQAYDNENEIKTSLIEGCIEVKRNNQSYLLEPGNQAILSKDTFIVNKIFEIDEVLAWRQNMFVFQKLEIETLMRQISRWYNVTVVYDDIIPDKFTISVPRDLSLPQLLDVLQSTSKVHFKIVKNTVIVTK